jgi:two-component system OmpR family response regulator
MRLLLVESDRTRADELGALLRAQGYAVDPVASAPDALFHAGEFAYDVLLVERNGHGFDGVELCGQLRARQCWIPVVMLADALEGAEAARALDTGVDDYLRRPFEAVELLARLRAVTRRDPSSRPSVLQVGNLSLDPATRRVRRGEAQIDLSAKEFALLQEFMRHPGAALSRSHLIEHVWDFAYDGGSNVVDVYVRYLRDKIDRPFGRSSVRTVRAVGYRLDPNG